MAIESVAVTGGSGYIGSETLRLVNERGYRTVNLDRRRASESVATEFYETDLLDAGHVYGSLAAADVDAVVHMGTIANPLHNPGFVTYESNVMTSYHLLEAARSLNIDAVCLASSINVLGNIYQETAMEVQYLPVDEKHPRTPRDPYSIAKHVIEITADGFGRLDGSPRTISTLRFPFVGVEEALRQRYVEMDRSLESLAAMEPIVSGSEHRLADVRDSLFSYIHIEDAATAASAAIESSFEGHESFWIAAADTTADIPSVRLAQECYPDAEIRNTLSGTDSFIDTSKAKEILEWAPMHSWRTL